MAYKDDAVRRQRDRDRYRRITEERLDYASYYTSAQNVRAERQEKLAS